MRPSVFGQLLTYLPIRWMGAGTSFRGGDSIPHELAGSCPAVGTHIQEGLASGWLGCMMLGWVGLVLGEVG